MYITSLLRLLCHLKVQPPVCFVCCAATTAGNYRRQLPQAASSAVPRPNLSPVWSALAQKLPHCKFLIFLKLQCA